MRGNLLLLLFGKLLAVKLKNRKKKRKGKRSVNRNSVDRGGSSAVVLTDA